MALKKEFSERDIQRMRNLITGKTDEKTGITTGKVNQKIDRKEGDIWEEQGKTWTIKEGIKQNVTKLDKAKQAYIVPLFCPECNKIMNKRNDKDFYKAHKMCFNCVVDMEHNLRKQGKFKDYERNLKNDHIDNLIKDFKTFMEEKKNETSKSYVTEAGDVERWIGKLDHDRVDEHIKEAVEYLENLKQ